jgi:hypothetical protein
MRLFFGTGTQKEDEQTTQQRINYEGEATFGAERSPSPSASKAKQTKPHEENGLTRKAPSFRASDPNVWLAPTTQKSGAEIVSAAAQNVTFPRPAEEMIRAAAPPAQTIVGHPGASELSATLDTTGFASGVPPEFDRRWYDFKRLLGFWEGRCYDLAKASAGGGLTYSEFREVFGRRRF